jgi:hypothetical protein
VRDFDCELVHIEFFGSLEDDDEHEDEDEMKIRAKNEDSGLQQSSRRNGQDGYGPVSVFSEFCAKRCHNRVFRMSKPV